MFNSFHAEFEKWTCPTLNLDQSICQFQGPLDGNIKLQKQQYRVWQYCMDMLG